MSTEQDTLLQVFNNQNPKIKLAYELFDFPLNNEVFTPKNVGLIIASFYLKGRKTIFNTIFKKGTGLELIEENLISKVLKLINPT